MRPSPLRAEGALFASQPRPKWDGTSCTGCMKYAKSRYDMHERRESIHAHKPR